MTSLTKQKQYIPFFLGVFICFILSILSFAYFSENDRVKPIIFQAAQKEPNVGELIPASLKRVRDYPSELENKTLEEIIELSKGEGETAQKAKKLKKLVEQQRRLKEKF